MLCPARLIFLLAICAVPVILQIFLSKKESKWPGLVLPFTSLGISVMAFLGILLFSAYTYTTTLMVNGEVVQQTTPTQIGYASSIVVGAVYVFVLYNIPTAVLLAIYAGCRSKRNKLRALEKMSAQDLE